MKVKEESEKVGLKLNIQKMKIMASDPTTSWQIDGETVETVTDFIWGGSKITGDGDYSHEIKTLWKKSCDQPRQHIKKQKHYFSNKSPYSQSYDLCGYESWTLKKAECRRIDAFFKKLIYFNWRLIYLQYCIGFLNCGVGEDS